MKSSILTVTAWLGLAASSCVAGEVAKEPSSARFRNEALAARAKPAEREAILAVTKWGANVILDEAGSVRAVHLNGCVFPESTLAVLAHFPKIEQLNLGHTKITDGALHYVKDLDSLESLGLTQTDIGDAGLAHLVGLDKLKSLGLHMTQVTDAGMQSVARLQGLEQLDLENTRVGDDGVRHLRGLTGLKKLLLSRSRVTDAGLAHLAGLTNLEELALYHNDISAGGIQSLRTLTRLKELDLEGTALTDDSLESLTGMNQLETLNVRDTRVTTKGLRQLKGLTTIRRLWADGAQFFHSVPEKQWQVWLANAYGDDIHIYELDSFKLLKRLEVGPNPHGLSASADGRTVHVALESFDEPYGELVFVDPRTFDITGRVRVGPQPNEQECTPDGRWIYVPCSDGKWYVVDGERKEVVTTIETGGRPHNTVVSPDGRRMYLSPLGYPHAVTVVDVAAGHEAIGEIPFRNVTRPPAITRDERLFFENIDGMLGFQVADIGLGEVVQTVRHAIPPARRDEWSRSHGLGVRPDQTEIWTCNVEHHIVHVHELTSGEYEEIAALAMPGRPYWLSFSPDGRYCFVSIRSKRQVAVVDCASKHIVTMLDAGRAEKRSQVVGVPLE